MNREVKIKEMVVNAQGDRLNICFESLDGRTEYFGIVNVMKISKPKTNEGRIKATVYNIDVNEKEGTARLHFSWRTGPTLSYMSKGVAISEISSIIEQGIWIDPTENNT